LINPEKWCGEIHTTPSTEKAYVNQQVTHFDVVSNFVVKKQGILQ
jgi:hypothetical protein